jgi:uroporphyrinogen decarboxylase
VVNENPMNARENFLRILTFDHPERVISTLPVYRLHYFGMDHEGFDGGRDDGPLGSRWTDIWGTGWHKIQRGVMGLPEVCPLARVDTLAGYAWPDPDDPRLAGPLEEQARAFPGGELLLAASHRDTLWEKAYMLVGMENMMMYFLTEPDFAREVLHRIMDFQLGMARHYLRLGARMAFLGDDLGTQQGPLLGPRIVRAFLEPEYRRLFAFYRQHGVRIDFHSCGNVASVVEMFMELGVDLLNPVQASANHLDRLRQVTQGRMALRGGVSSATIMAGPPERIAAEVRQRLRQLGAQGGYVCQPDQSMPYPPAHLRAFEQAVERYGRYPIE